MLLLPWVIALSTMLDLVESTFFPPPPPPPMVPTVGPTLLLPPPVLPMVPMFQQNLVAMFPPSIGHLRHKHLKGKTMMMLGLSGVAPRAVVYRPVTRQGTYSTITSITDMNNIRVNNVVPNINGGINNVDIGRHAIVQNVPRNDRTVPPRGRIVYVRQSRANPTNDITNNIGMNNNNVYNNNNNNNIGTLLDRTSNSGFTQNTMVEPQSVRGSRTIVATRGTAITGHNNVVIGNRETQPVNTVIDQPIATQGRVQGATGRDYYRGLAQSTATLGPDLSVSNNEGLRPDGRGREALLPASMIYGSNNVEPLQPAIRGRTSVGPNQRIYTPIAERNVIGNYNAGQTINNDMHMGATGAGRQSIPGVSRSSVLQTGGFDRQSGIHPSSRNHNNAVNDNNYRIHNFDSNRRMFTHQTQPNQNFNNNVNTNNQIVNMDAIPSNFNRNSVREQTNVDIAGIEFIGRRGGGQGIGGTSDNRNLNGLNDRNIGRVNQAMQASGRNNNNFETGVGPIDRIIHADQQVSADMQLRAGNNILNGNNLNVGNNMALDMNNQFGPAYDHAASPTRSVGVGVTQRVRDQRVGVDIRTGAQSETGSNVLNENINPVLNGGPDYNQNTLNSAQGLNQQNSLNNAQDFVNQNDVHTAQDFINQEAFNSLQRLGPKDIFRQPLTGRTLDFRFMGSQLPASSGSSQGAGGGPSVEISISSDLLQDLQDSNVGELTRAASHEGIDPAENVGIDVFGNVNLNQNADLAITALNVGIDSVGNAGVDTALNQNMDMANTALPAGFDTTGNAGVDTPLNQNMDMANTALPVGFDTAGNAGVDTPLNRNMDMANTALPAGFDTAGNAGVDTPLKQNMDMANTALPVGFDTAGNAGVDTPLNQNMDMANKALPAGFDTAGNAGVDTSLNQNMDMINTALPAGVDTAGNAGVDTALNQNMDMINTALPAGVDTAGNAGVDTPLNQNMDMANTGLPAGFDTAGNAGVGTPLNQNMDMANTALPVGFDTAGNAGVDAPLKQNMDMANTALPVGFDTAGNAGVDTPLNQNMDMANTALPVGFDTTGNAGVDTALNQNMDMINTALPAGFDTAGNAGVDTPLNQNMDMANTALPAGFDTTGNAGVDTALNQNMDMINTALPAGVDTAGNAGVDTPLNQNMDLANTVPPAGFDTPSNVRVDTPLNQNAVLVNAGPSVEIAPAPNDMLSNTNFNQNNNFANAAPSVDTAGNVGVDVLSNANYMGTDMLSNTNINQNNDFANTASLVDTISTPVGGLNTVIPMEGVAVASAGVNNLVNSAVDAYPQVSDTGPLVVTDFSTGANAVGDTIQTPLSANTAMFSINQNVVPITGDPITNSVAGKITPDTNALDMNKILAQNQSSNFKLIDLPPGNKINPSTGIQVFEVTSDINGILAGSTVHDLGPVDVFSIDGGKTKSGQGGNVQIVVLDGAQAGGLLGNSAKMPEMPVNTDANIKAPSADRAPLRISAQSINMSGVGRLGKSVGSVPASSGEVLGVFSLPSGLKLPNVDPSVSAIPESIERAAAAVSSGPSTQPLSPGRTP